MMTTTPEEIATQLTPQQRVFLFCVASGTEWQRFDIQSPTVQLTIIKNLIERLHYRPYFVVTELGRAVLSALLAGGRR
jgi:hypothetical protein